MNQKQLANNLISMSKCLEKADTMIQVASGVLIGRYPDKIEEITRKIVWFQGIIEGSALSNDSKAHFIAGLVSEGIIGKQEEACENESEDEIIGKYPRGARGRRNAKYNKKNKVFSEDRQASQKELEPKKSLFNQQTIDKYKFQPPLIDNMEGNISKIANIFTIFSFRIRVFGYCIKA